MRLSRFLLRAREGQSRILESVIAAVIVFIVFSVSMFFIRTSDVRVLQERADLDRLGYNVLHKLVEFGTIEVAVEGDGGTDCLKTVVQRSMPSTTYFNLTVFKCKPNNFQLIRVANADNTSANPEPFADSLEVSSTNVIYTSKKGNIYFLVLVLARAGAGS